MVPAVALESRASARCRLESGAASSAGGGRAAAAAVVSVAVAS